VQDLRCPSRYVARVVDGRLEVKCSSRNCGSGGGVVVLHYFDVESGELQETKTYRSPERVFENRKV
jgi:hypothetical protein